MPHMHSAISHPATPSLHYRYAQLQKRQELMIQDMERAIYKRDNIEAKGKTMAGKKGAPPTSAALAKQLLSLIHI